MPNQIPKTIGACVDLYYKLREKRLEEEKKIAEMKKFETEVAEHICREMPRGGATGVRGKVANFTVEPITVPHAKDWDEVFAYVKKNNAFYLLQRRLNDKAVREIWESGKELKGVDKFETFKFHCTKV